MCWNVRTLLLGIAAASHVTATFTRLAPENHGGNGRGHKHHRRHNHHVEGAGHETEIISDMKLGLGNLTHYQDFKAPSRHRLNEVPKHALGSTAIMSEAGYQAVLATHSKPQMLSFAQRVLQHHGLRSTDDKHLQGMLKFYDGDCATQSYSAMLREFKKAQSPFRCFNAWIVPGKSSLMQIDSQERLPELESELSALPDDAPLPTWQWLLRGPPETMALLQGSSNVTGKGDTIDNSGRKAGKSDVIDYSGIGYSATLDEGGYHSVAKLKDDNQMRTFIHRTLGREGLHVTNEEAFRGMVPWYSGRCAEQSYKTLVKEAHLAMTKPTSCGGPWVAKTEGGDPWGLNTYTNHW